MEGKVAVAKALVHHVIEHNIFCVVVVSWKVRRYSCYRSNHLTYLLDVVFNGGSHFLLRKEEHINTFAQASMACKSETNSSRSEI